MHLKFNVGRRQVRVTATLQHVPKYKWTYRDLNTGELVSKERLAWRRLLLYKKMKWAWDDRCTDHVLVAWPIRVEFLVNGYGLGTREDRGAQIS